MFSRHFAAAVVCLVTSFSFAADAVPVQPADRIAADLRGAAPTVQVQESSRINDALTAYSKTSMPADPGRVLTKDEEIERLKALPGNRVPFKQVTLASAIRLLADDARMNYIAPPEGAFSERVQANITMNDYELLGVLGENFGFGMEYDSKGLWRFYKINLNELVTKAYTIHFSTGDRVSINSTSINNQLMGNSYNSSMSGGTGSPHPSTDGGAKGNFDVKAGKVIEDIKKIVAIPTVGVNTPTLENSAQFPGRAADKKGETAPQVEPIWNPDTSQLFVVATRQQHSLIEAYLKTLDQPQELIRIAAKFIETARNPQRDFGVNWSNTVLGNGGAITLGGSGSGSSGNNTGGNATASANPLATNVDLNHVRNTVLPQAVLSAPAFQITMQAFATDRMSSVVQDPTLLTTNNRIVTFKATTQQPVQQSSTNIGSSTTTSTAQIVYLEIGTVISVLPIIRPGNGFGHEEVELNISIIVSSIVGEKIVGGNPYPITSSKTYEYQVTIPNGYTLAIAGLEERSRDTTDSKVPIFGDIPFIGYAFKSRSDNMTRTTLLAFITPDIIRTRPPEGPADALMLPDPTRQIFDGTKNESLAQVGLSLAGIPTDISALERVANTVNRDLVLNRLERIGVELGLIEVRLGELKVADKTNTDAEDSKVALFRTLLAAAQSAVTKITPSR